MSSLDQAVQTHLANIQKKTGKSLDELAEIVHQSGLTKHSEIRSYLQREPGLGYGDANAVVHAVLRSDGQRATSGKSEAAVLDGIYWGAKAGFRPIHEKLIMEINRFGEYEMVPKEGYVSLRRRKQFAMIGPKTNTGSKWASTPKIFQRILAYRSSLKAACAITSSTCAM